MANGALTFGPLAGVLIFFTVGLLSVSFIIPLAVGPDTSPIPAGPGSGSGEYHYLQTPCGCSNPVPVVAGVDYGTTERQVSNEYFNQDPGQDIPDPMGLSSLAVFWGQLIDHEITRSADDANATSVTIAFNESINQTMTTILSQVNPTTQCLEPKNELAPMIDGSAVYSDYKDAERLTQLRVSPTACKLRLDSYGLPPIENGTFFCGDTRCGEHVVLTSLHAVLAREHNRWCDKLAAEHPSTTEDARFWWARALVVSIMQRITLEEWLPALLGSQQGLLVTVPIKEAGLGLSVEFSVLAFRFGHSMVPDTLGPWNLTDLFFQNDFIRTNGIENVLRHAVETPAQRMDTHVVNALRNILFGMMGEDLIARNLFRARQLGAPTYAELVSCYGINDPITFPEGHPAHTDALLALFSEPLVPGSSLPRTIATIVSETFRRLRDHDPNWYTQRVAQLHPQYYSQVAQTTLATLIRRNTGLSTLKGDVFFV